MRRWGFYSLAGGAAAATAHFAAAAESEQSGYRWNLPKGFPAPHVPADNPMKRLEGQALVPMFGEHPVELGLKRDSGFPERARTDAIYRELFPALRDPRFSNPWRKPE